MTVGVTQPKALEKEETRARGADVNVHGMIQLTSKTDQFKLLCEFLFEFSRST